MSIITEVNITHFGPFNDFKWSESVYDTSGSPSKFRKLNILYGRNYSGKTTLSRLFRSLETRTLPANYESPVFTIATSEGPIDQAGLENHSLCVRVYNKDFVDDHLGFLRNDDGEIAAFALLGDENREIEEAIAKSQSELGSIEEQQGLLFELDAKQERARNKKGEVDTARSDLQRKLTRKATRPDGGIKHEPIYNLPNYNRARLEADLTTVREKQITALPEEQVLAFRRTAGEQHLPDIDSLSLFKARSVELAKDAKLLLSQLIVPTAAIQDLLDNPDLQKWVRKGILHHRDQRNTCGFCGTTLPSGLWDRLDAHFSEASTELENAIDGLITRIEQEKLSASGLKGVHETLCYQELADRIQAANSKLDEGIGTYIASLDELACQLNTRKAQVFDTVNAVPIVADETPIAVAIKAINELVSQHNGRSQSLADVQAMAKNKLRLNEVASFAEDIQYEKELATISKMEDEASAFGTGISDTQELVDKLNTTIRKLESQVTDEKKGAERVNDFLSRYFGHANLRLDAVRHGNTAQFKFKVMRGTEPAFNLSEGECSLIAFCYFMARLEAADSNGKQPIIFIDDPISSLDSNHVFFLFSLLESVLAQPRKDRSGDVICESDGSPSHVYSQLFISTHNLEFLKYLKRLKRPKGKNTEQFLVQQKKIGSDLCVMPGYLREYITEFNFLFSQIVTCADAANEVTDHHSFYNFGNNLRKFLEAYLFFRFPFSESSTRDHNSRLQRFFAESYGEDAMVQRIGNELSHLTEHFDRGMKPIDYSEIAKMAKFILQKLKARDQEQYADLLSSVDVEDPLG